MRSSGIARNASSSSGRHRICMSGCPPGCRCASGPTPEVLASYAMTSYPASCYGWLGDYRQAEAYARRAVAVHEAAPDGSRAPTPEAIAQIDLAIAVAALGEPDERSALGRAALSSARVVDSVRSRAGDLDAMLAVRYVARPVLPASVSSTAA